MEVKTMEQARQALKNTLALLDALTTSGRKNAEYIYTAGVIVEAVDKFLAEGGEQA